jgi:hypothetical protein
LTRTRTSIDCSSETSATCRTVAQSGAHLVRDEGVAGQNPATPINTASERALGSGEVVRVMMPVSYRQYLDCHSKITRRLPHVGPGLHQPSRRRVAQDVRGDFLAETGVRHHVRECLIDALNGLAIPLDDEPLPVPFPAAQVR